MKIKAFILLVITLTHISLSAQQVRKGKELLTGLTRDIEQGKYPKLHSLLIAKDNKITYTHYFNGFTKDSVHDTRSSFKSITALLVGIAIDKGFIKNVDQPVADFFPDNKAFKDQLKRSITLRNLLEMKSGFDCEEFNDTKDCEDEMSRSNDWVQFCLNLPMKNKPGSVWAYTSVNPMIISGIIKQATGMPVQDFARKYLFAPMGITKYKWTVDPIGNGMTAGSFYILPADLLKIAELVNRDGLWNKQQLISKKWIYQSTTCNIPIPDFSFMKSSKSTIGTPQQAYYGYYWYKETLKTPTVNENVLFASGNGGQYIFIIKSLNLTVVFTQGNYGSFKAKQAFDILVRYIIPLYKP